MPSFTWSLSWECPSLAPGPLGVLLPSRTSPNGPPLGRSSSGSVARAQDARVDPQLLTCAAVGEKLSQRCQGPGLTIPQAGSLRCPALGLVLSASGSGTWWCPAPQRLPSISCTLSFHGVRSLLHETLCSSWVLTSGCLALSLAEGRCVGTLR